MDMRRSSRVALGAATLAALAGGPADGASRERIAASPLIAPCAAEAAATLADAPLVFTADRAAAVGAADVFVGPSVEVTRAIESGTALEGSDVALIEVPWVLVGESAAALATLDGAAAAGAEIALPSDGAAADARRAVLQRAGARLRALGLREVAAAALSLVPRPLAGERPFVAVDVEPLRVRAVVLAGAVDPDAARKLAQRLAAALAHEVPETCGGNRHGQ